MSDELFPKLPGLKWDVMRGTSFSTTVYEALSGAERRFGHRTLPKYRTGFSYEFLRNHEPLAEVETLLAFFEDRMGAADSFLYHDAFLGGVSNLQFGTGDGTTTDFQLVRRFGNRNQVIHNPDPSLAIGRVFFPTEGNEVEFWPEPDGVWPLAEEYEPPEGGWELLPNGIVSFAVPPPAGKRLLWSGRYYYRARFADDKLDYSEFCYRIFNQQKVELVLSLQNIL